MNPVLELTGVELRLGSFEVRVTLAVASGITGLFGPSGAGKTSLLEAIAGLRKPSRGAIKLGDEVLVDTARRVMRPARSRRIGYVPQDLALFPHLSVERNIRYAANAVPSAALDFDVICRVLELGAKLHRDPGSLSGGEQQRVALARALMSGPRLLLLDEPLSSLDQELKDALIPFLGRIRETFALPIVYVTHDANEVMALCDSVVLLDAGRVVAHGRPVEFFQPASTPRYVRRPPNSSGARP